MDFDLFKKENEIIAQAEECLRELPDNEHVLKQFELLLGEYKKLFKTSKRLIKLSDRNEKELLAANKEIASKKQQLEQAQDELVQAEKLASLGQLVAGVAHEINTPVGIILTSASALKKENDHLRDLMASGQAKKSTVSEYLETSDDVCGLLIRHAETTSELIRSFKSVSVDRNVDDARSFELNSYIDDVIRSIRPSMKSSKVSLNKHLAGAISMQSYPGALNQIVTNIILNAYKHGLEDGSREGEISVSTEEEKDIARITIIDTGKGIPNDFISKIFDPFVTSARGDGGTGLGLNIVYNLVTAKLGGKITVESDGSEQGAKFSVEIPKTVCEK